jgi:nucleoside-diphosphate-sugar epimerase
VFLITGANGFIGSTLMQVARAQGHQVRGAGRSGTAPDPDWVSVGEIGPHTDWSRALNSVDVVIHLAGRAHVLQETALDPLAEFRRVNVAGTERLARMAAGRIRRLVYVSSIGVNGSNTGGSHQAASFREEDSPHPHNAYSISKWEAEQGLRHVAEETGLEFVLVRPPLVYGPGVPANFLQLLRFVYRGLPLPFAGVENRRSLIGVQNLAEFLLLCAQHPAAANELFLTSDGDDISTADLVRRLARALHKPARLFRAPEWLIRTGARIIGRESAVDQLMGSLVVDSQKARCRLGWKPPLSVDQGLAQVADWYVSQAARRRA